MIFRPRAVSVHTCLRPSRDRLTQALHKPGIALARQCGLGDELLTCARYGNVALIRSALEVTLPRGRSYSPWSRQMWLCDRSTSPVFSNVAVCSARGVDSDVVAVQASRRGS